MDANKLKVLQEIGYSVRKVCGNCAFSDIAPTAFWGTCSKHAYTHLKHTGADRDLSVRFDGHCDKHEFRSEAVENLRGFGPFLEK
jgi:hypothetical protein